MNTPTLFPSFFMGGFECSTHLRPDGVRLDLLRATRHDELAAQDYRALQAHGIYSVRDGLRWHLIEAEPGRYDWRSFLPMLHAARDTSTTVIWDLCHYGWPPHIDIWSNDFPTRFAKFASAVAALLRDETQDAPFYCPVNEISFWAWAGGDMRLFAPNTTRRGMELKCQLVRASIAATRAIREADPRARIVHVDPVIHVVTKTPRNRREGAHAQEAQYEAWEMLRGTLHPELGGGPDCLDVMGVNFYGNNQWYLRGKTIEPGSPNYRPFRDILAETYHRFKRPLFVAETGAEGERRSSWFRYVCDEVHAARHAGIPIEGVCLYPITDYPGWADDRHCECGLLGMASNDGVRQVYPPLAEELSQQLARIDAYRNAPSGPSLEEPASARLKGGRGRP